MGWGLFSVLLVKFVHVPIEGAVLKIPTIIAEGIAFVLTVAAAVDVTQSFNDAMDLKRILAQLEESKKQIRKIQEKLKVASEEFVEDYRQSAGEFVEDYRQRAGEFVEDYRRRVEEHVEDYRGRAEEMAEDYKKLAEEHMDSYRQRAEEMVEGYKEEIKVQKKKRREQINSRILCKGDDDTACKGKEAVGSLRRIVGFQGKTDLNNTEAEQDKSDCTDESENEIGQIVDNGQRISACRKCGHRHTADKCHTKHNGAVGTKALFNLSGHRQLLGFLVVGFLKNIHCVYLHKFNHFQSPRLRGVRNWFLPLLFREPCIYQSSEARW